MLFVWQAVRDAEAMRRRAEGLVPREDLQASAKRVRELEAELSARAAALASMVPASVLAAAHEEIRQLRDTCVMLEDGARRAAMAEAAVAAAKEEALVALQEVRRLRGCLDGSVPRAAAEAAEAQLDGLAAEVAWLRRLVASMDQVCYCFCDLRDVASV